MPESEALIRARILLYILINIILLTSSLKYKLHKKTFIYKINLFYLFIIHLIFDLILLTSSLKYKLHKTTLIFYKVLVKK